ncbi:glycoside hydrolase family 81 [Tumebacillus sp. ITR2]|uniref:glucan endo-1,3-beta-D-glucosidase n=1 Tax=Tumebacillus amylolyticus TaxID=2801339 RepID=A0ABS1J6L7_9BACL|nr:glycosyl hydrolase [Tumebacillus amylolyticus]MBL0385714.1 glycoside hydrolase family 81 [Tumebacillus amylolyticus]
MSKKKTWVGVGTSLVTAAALTWPGAGVGFAGTTVAVGAGSYTTALPAGQTGVQGAIYKTANVTGAMPTNDWWSSVAWEQYSDAMFPHPLAVQAGQSGLALGYPTQSAASNTMYGSMQNDMTLGTVAGTYPDTKVDGYSDWTVSMLWSNGANSMRVTSGHGLPFVYSTFAGTTPKLTFGSTPTVWSGGNGSNVLGVTVNGRHYALFGPTGSAWSGVGTSTLTNNLGGKNYLSIAVLPDNSAATLNAFKAYAYSFVTDTKVSWSYNASTSKVSTTYNVTTTPKEGTQTGTIMALYPHEWKSTTTPLSSYTYDSIRGTMKTVTGSSFTTALTYQGITPYLPPVGDYDAATLNNYVEQVRTEVNNHNFGTSADSYWGGKYLQRISNLVPVAQQLGNTAAVNNFESFLESKLSEYLKATDSTGAVKANNLFYYDNNWGTLIGYPASYGSNNELNDHHFHYGYWIRAAAEVARNNPAWAQSGNWGGMVNTVVKDIANWDRTDTSFPFLRNFDPYAGHSWASGHAKFGDGNNQESSSEAVNAWAALILWGEQTGNTQIRDLGIYLYTTETQAVNQYWFNVDGTNFKPGFNHNYSSMIWGGKSDYATWFTADVQKIRGINILPVTAASNYLGYSPTYSANFLNQLKAENGNSNAWTSWADILWEYQALYDPAGAIALFNANPGYTPEEGESKAHTYHWLHELNVLGQLDTTVTANTPLYAVYKKGTTRNYVAYNASSTAKTVTFSDGKTLSVPANSIATSAAPNNGGGGGGGTDPTPSTGNLFYVKSGGALSTTAGTTALTDTIASAGGVNHDGTPTNPSVYTISNVSGTYDSTKATGFDLFVDAGANIADGVQAQVQYDFTGDGTWDRTETYSYFPTNDVVGFEDYKQTQGLQSASGTFQNLSNGKVRIQVWNAIGNSATTLRVNAGTSEGSQSKLTIPFN